MCGTEPKPKIYSDNIMNKCHHITKAEWETDQQRYMETLNHQFYLIIQTRVAVAQLNQTLSDAT